jgi:hypothetical protein
MLFVVLSMLAFVAGCQSQREKTDWRAAQIEFIGKGQPAPFAGVLMTERIVMELLEDYERETLKRRYEDD